MRRLLTPPAAAGLSAMDICRKRFIQTGIGPVSVRQPRVRDRGDGAIRFTSAILPRYLRRAKSLEDLLPWLYLKGISTGDFGEALAALLGSSAPGLSASTITRLKEVWGVEAERWQRRDLTAKRYVYFWVDGIYFSARMEEEKQCILVIVGATDKGQKELIAIADGYRESEQSWLEVLLDLKRRGLELEVFRCALGDGVEVERTSHILTGARRCAYRITAKTPPLAD